MCVCVSDREYSRNTISLKLLINTIERDSNAAGMFANLSLTENKRRIQIYGSVKNIYSRGIRFVQGARYRMVVVEISSRRVVIPFISRRVYAPYLRIIFYSTSTLFHSTPPPKPISKPRNAR